MAITVKHNKVSTVPDGDDTSVVRPSDWNADHTLVGTIDVANGGTGASTLTGYVKGNGTSAMTASATVPSTDITGLGTMSTQNANAVAITGGTINGTTVGSTTPSTVNATTLSGQTGVLRGTGQNFILYSQAFNTTSFWTNTGLTVTADTTTAPDSTLTADSVVETSATSGHLFTFTAPVTTGQVYTISIYAKVLSGTRNLFIYGQNATAYVGLNAGAKFSVSGSTISTSTLYGTTTSSVTSVGNGWYRCSATFPATVATSAVQGLRIALDDGTGTPSGGAASYAGNGTSGFYLWGAQLELSNSAGTYIPTTTTAIYGTPTLSFSGVSEIGLLSNGALYLQPAGTGAIQAQATTSTSAGGNVRGANAVDWQTSRGTAAQVASSTYAVISGGQNNSATGGLTAVVGGFNNTSSGNSAFVGGGQYNVASGTRGVVAGGDNNTAAGFFNFIGSGFTNAGTANASVTTQSGTMNATTAVTLSGSNASIKVGQYITGTSIAQDTYVAAISGTALTLSKVASGSSTSTLSFFTPHGVVVGGGNNQATGSYSFIGGGGDAGTAANRNVASGDWSTVGGGYKNVASGNASFVGGGFTNTASATGAFIGGGGNFGSQTASGQGAFIGAGWGNNATGAGTVCLGIGGIANADYSSTIGGTYGIARSIQGNTVFAASNAPLGTVFTNQAALLILARQTTDATATVLTSNSSAASTTNQVILPNNSAYLFKATVISNVTGGGNTSGWKLEGVIKRGANAASTTIVGLVTTTLLAQDAGAATWAIAATADTTNGGLRITFTGQASTTIRTVCKVETTEVTF